MLHTAVAMPSQSVSPAYAAVLDVYSHNVSVTKFGPEVRRLLVEFCRRQALMGPVRVGPGRYEQEMKKIFAEYTRTRDEFRFHRNQLSELISFLSYYGVKKERLQQIEHATVDPEEIDFPLQIPHAPRPEQVPQIDYATAPCKEGFAPSKVVMLQTGKGKAVALDVPVRVPGGWKPMGEVKVDDFVIGKDGKPARVSAVYPQPEKQLYSVQFADGRSVEVCGEHLWKVYYVNTQPHKRWRVVNTLEVLRLISMPNPRVYIELCDAEETPHQDLPMDPYTLGYLLGNGHLGNNMLGVSSADEFCIQQIEAALPTGMYMARGTRYNHYIRHRGREGNPYSNILKQLGVYGHLANSKFVPEQYLNGSIEQRWSLLQGLFDSDGTVQKSGSVSFSSVSIRLAEDVQYLVRSLGGIAAIRPRQTHYTHNGVKLPGQICYDVDVRMRNASNLFRLPRKKDRTNDRNQYAEILKLRVVSVTPSRTGLSQCITVENDDHQFVVKDFIVTHNTFVSFQVMAKIRRRTMIIIPAKFIAMWTKEVEKAFGFKGKQVWCVRGSADFKAMINVALSGGEIPPVIIVSSATYTNFLDAYKEQLIPEHGGYGIHPNDLFKTLKVGLRLIDEVHMDFHRNFRIDLYTHIPRTLSLSATLEADNKFTNTRYRIVWPPETHPPEFEYDCFIDVLSIMYSLKRPELIRCKGFAKMYSHVKFEESIMKNKYLLEAYVDMIVDLTERMYIEDRLKGQKMFIICSTVNMCTILANKLQLDHPELLVERYVSEDDYEKNCLTPDIVVTTIGSGGTGVDVPNLRETLNTVALDSRQASQQALGRTRRLKDFPDVHPRYSMLYAREIDKHVQYCRAKDEKFRGKVRSMRITETHYKV